MVSVLDTVASTKIMWNKRYGDPVKARWKVLMESLLGFDKQLLLQKRIYKGLKSKPKTNFYCSLMSTWFSFITIEPRSFKEFLLEPLFCNDLITIEKSAINNEYSDLAAGGVNRVQDIVKEDGTFLSKHSIEAQYGISLDQLRYNKLVSCLKAKIKMIPKRFNTNPHPNIPKLCLENIGKVKFKSVYNHLIQSYHNVPTSETKWIEYYPFLESVNWKRVYSLSSQIPKDSFAIALQ